MAPRVMLKYQAAGSCSPWAGGSDRNANTLQLGLRDEREASLSMVGDRVGSRRKAPSLGRDRVNGGGC